MAGRSQTKKCCMPSQRYFATVCFKTCAILVSQSEKYSIHGTSLEVKSLIAELLIFIHYYYLFIYLQKKRISIQKLSSCCDHYHVWTGIIFAWPYHSLIPIRLMINTKTDCCGDGCLHRMCSLSWNLFIV